MADNFATMNFVYEEKRPVKVDPVDSHQWRSLGEEGSPGFSRIAFIPPLDYNSAGARWAFPVNPSYKLVNTSNSDISTINSS
jgi:hypothetical protein